MRKRFTAGLAAVVAAVYILSMTGCSPQPGQKIPKASPGSAAEAVQQTPESRKSAAANLGAAGDIRQVAWQNLAVPGDFCGVEGLVQLQNGTAQATSATFGVAYISIYAKDSAYGDVDGDNIDEAAVNLGCHNGSGTGDGHLAHGYLVVTVKSGAVVWLGTVVAQQQLPQVLPTVLKNVRIEGGRILVDELWYRNSDSTCCPSGKAVTSWSLQGRQLVAGKPSIIS